MITQDAAYKEIERLVQKFNNTPPMRKDDSLDRVRLLDMKIASVDEEMDRKVYELYGLTEEDIKIVEGG